VRIIEYTITIRAADGTTRIEPFRLVTTLLDRRQALAAELAALYHERREIENGNSEMKTRLRGAAFILRSRSPELVRQEVLAFLTVYQALCALKAEAARHAGLDPDPDLLHSDRPHRPPEGQQPGRQHPGEPGPGTPPGNPRPHRRPSAQATGPAMRAGPEAAEEHLPVQETRPRTAAQPSHLPDQNQTDGTLTSANALTHWHCPDLGE